LSQKLEKQGISSAAIHGNKTQNARTKALAGFKAGNIRTLVATDIAARGLDIPLLPHVINYELPNVPEDYVHRIGRTGRAGASGEAISLVGIDERPYLRDIESLLKQRLDSEVVKGFEPTDEAESKSDKVAKLEAKKQHFQNRRKNMGKRSEGNGRDNFRGNR
jgi:ATP-dependent RNA helicase RhlE